MAASKTRSYWTKLNSDLSDCLVRTPSLLGEGIMAAGGGAHVYGKIQYVDRFPDYKVQVVKNFADLHVQIVRNFPNSPGKWQIVDRFPDYKIQIVDRFPDFTIKFVDHFPGPR